ncbi:hypothetical protein ABZ235_22745 [Streptomyces canus]|uniref:hypothetical protein n=1 Tax=Streptomyces canus TaxID=58343 RepID=UPI0033B87123
MGDRRRRRRLAAAATVAGLMFTTAACGSGSDSAGSSDPNTLEVWTRSNPDSAATYDRAFAAFTKKTGIKIDYVLAGAVVALIPSLIVYLLLQRSLVTGIAAGATKG